MIIQSRFGEKDSIWLGVVKSANSFYIYIFFLTADVVYQIDAAFFMDLGC